MIRTAHMTALLGAIGVCAITCSSTAGEPWELVWSDEFDGTSLDLTNWEPMIGNGAEYGVPGWGNNELQYYTDRAENIAVSGGVLRIIARDENYNGYDYTSARLRTLNKRDFLYGRFEARMRLPSGQGIWPALWMLPTGSPYGGWAASGEIDIMESVNFADTIYGTIHHGSNWPNNVHDGGTFNDGTNFAQTFHEYAVEWEPDEIRWYVNGVHYHTETSDDWYSTSGAAAGNPRAPFDNPFHLLLNVAVGGNFPGDPNGSTPFPQVLTVDYVRVYQAAQTPYLGSPIPVPGRVECEDFDEGFQGQAYNDTDAGNNGEAYRPDGDVDIQATSGGGFNIGWVGAGEWTEYTISVAQTGTYDVDFRVASPTGGGILRLELDGAPITGSVALPDTGGWQSWQIVETQVQLDAGEHILRLSNLNGPDRYNIDYVDFAFVPSDCPGDLNTTGTSQGDPDYGQPDGSTDLADLLYFVGVWQTDLGTTPGSLADVTTTGAGLGQPDYGVPDSEVDLSDLLFFVGIWQEGLTACP